MRTRLDIRLKLLQLVLLGGLALAADGPIAMLLIALGASVMLVLEGSWRGALAFVLGYSVIVFLLSRFGEALGAQSITLIFVYLLHFLLTFLPVLVVFFAVTARTEVSRLIQALTHLRLPRILILPIAVIFRFVPALLQEWHHIRDAMHLRGLGFGFGSLCRPVTTVELLVVPLLMRSLKIADELAACAMTRCIDLPGKKTVAHPMRFQVVDYVMLVSTVAWAGGVILASRV